MTKRAAIYCRISKDQAGTGLGVERQESECRALCDARGYSVVDVLTDNDLSAYSGRRRPAYERLATLMEHDVDVVVAWHPDRLTRQPRELETLIDTLERTGTTVATVQAGDYDLSTPAARMSARIVGAVARGESEHKSARLVSKSDQLAASGSAPGGRTPYGYDRDRVNGLSVYVVNPEQAKHLRWMAEQVLDGRSLLSVARDLDARGVPTKEGKPWHHSTVRAVLVNPAVAGLRVHRREIAGPGEWEPIVDRQTWEQVRATVADPARKRTRPARKYLLSGMIESAAGDPMVGRPMNGRRTYVTPKPDKGAFASIDAERTEALVVEAVLQHYDEVALEVPETTSSRQDEDVASIEAELAQLAEARGAGVITFAEWMAAREPLNARLEAAQAVAPKRIPDELAEVGNLRAAWNSPKMTDERKRILLREILYPVKISGAGGRGRWANPADRIEIKLR